MWIFRIFSEMIPVGGEVIQESVCLWTVLVSIEMTINTFSWFHFNSVTRVCVCKIDSCALKNLFLPLLTDFLGMFDLFSVCIIVFFHCIQPGISIGFMILFELLSVCIIVFFHCIQPGISIGLVVFSLLFLDFLFISLVPFTLILFIFPLMQFNNIERENCVVMLNIDAHKIFNITCLLILLIVISINICCHDVCVFCHGHFRTVCAGHVSDDN